MKSLKSKMVKTIPKIGGHVSAAGGLYRVIGNAEAIGAEAIQIFGASPRQWSPKFPGKEDFLKYKEHLAKSKVSVVYLHASYLVNLGSPDDELIKKSIINLSNHFSIAEKMGADGLIFHVGSGKELPKEEALARAAKAMKEVLKKVPGTSYLVIENAAGGGAKIGRTASEIGTLMKMVDDDRVKVCFDTAHAFEAGIIDEYTPQKTKVLFDEWDKEVGMKNIVALHINDSKTPFDSHHDRHENLGEGYIGLKGFKVLAKEKRLHHAAWMLEVPGFEGGGPDLRNVEILRSCFN